jgi:tritrans,polycis-undecaprenyl-diphosphate synthase [geranylgeranyl-diphosphate specific]
MDKQVPRHVAVIMDGNRRFSRRLMAKPWRGHEWGAEKFLKLIDWVVEAGVEELTVYAFSVQNFERTKEEFDFLMNVFRESARKMKEQQAHRKDVRIVFIGRLNLFPEDVRAGMNEIMEKTQNNSPYRVNIAVGYGGREEVIDAIRKLGERIEKGELSVAALNEEVFEKALYMDSEPDLVIRTGGDHRTSNFLIWQSHYSEWIFLEKLWPEFEKADLLACLDQYAARERRYGK